MDFLAKTKQRLAEILSTRKKDFTTENSSQNEDIQGNIFNDLQERISSPAVSSFLIGFLFANWKIIIVLFTYSREDLKYENLDYDTYIDFIKGEFSYFSYLWGLGIAFFYCWIYPWIREEIKTRNASQMTKGNNKIIKVSNTLQVPISSYTKLHDEYQHLLGKLKRTIEENDFSGTNFRKLDTENIILNNEKKKWVADQMDYEARISSLEKLVETEIAEREKLKSELRKIERNNSVVILNGVWELFIKEGLTIADTIPQLISFPEKLFMLKIPNSNYVEQFEMFDFFHNQSERKISLLAFNVQSRTVQINFILKYQPGSEIRFLEGDLYFNAGYGASVEMIKRNNPMVPKYKKNIKL